MSWYVYMLRCRDGSLYTGYTDDLQRRLAVHNSGKGAKYTRPLLPVELVYFESFETKEEAIAAAKADEKIVSMLEGKNIVKEIYVPGKIVNIVAK